MKEIFVCEKCNKHFDNWDDAYACENGHLVPDSSFVPELEKRIVYKPGNSIPDKLILPYQRRQWNEEKESYDSELFFMAYKFAGEVTPTERESILNEKAERDAREEAEMERWRQKWEAEKKAKAEQEAKAETESA